MFVKNRLDLLNLARDKNEMQILKEMLDSIDYIIESAQPHKLLSSSLSISDDFIEVEGKKFGI